MKKRTLLLTTIGFYILSAGISFAVFQKAMPAGITSTDGTSTGKQPSRFAQLISPLVPKAGQGKVDVKHDEPKTEACPLNGQMFTKAEREAWETRTPLAVMIENHTEARPQSGLSNADVVFESVAEGAITRFMALFYCGAQSSDVLLAPIRSARTYFIDWASSYQEPIYVHVGGANLPGPANALGQLEDYKWAGHNDFNQFSIGFPTFARNYNRITLADGKSLPTEHTMETSTERLWKYAKDSRSITTWAGKAKFTPWQFKDDAAEKDRGATGQIGYDFWEGYKDYHVDWTFDATSDSYARNQGGAPHKDLNNDQQIKARNVVVMFTTEKGPIDENKHMLYGTTGTGKALFFLDGKAVQGNWAKASRTAPLLFTTSNGKAMQFNRGLIWISNVATTDKVEY